MDKGKESTLKPKGMTKKEQLKVAFKALITIMFHRIETTAFQDLDDDKIVDETTELMVKEVSIRTTLK